MPDDPSTLNPYLAPTDPVPRGGKTGRPGMLSTICVIAIVMGALGAMNVLAGLGMYFLQPVMQQAFQPSVGPGVSREDVRQYRDIQDKTQAIADKHIVLAMSLLALAFLSSVGLILGGLKTLRLNDMGRKVLMATLVLCVVYELGHWTQQFMVMPEIGAAMRETYQKSIEELPPGSVQRRSQELTLTIVGISTTASLVFVVALGAVKLVYYFLTLIYLNRQPIRDLYLAKPRYS
jgi:hypothetical protein